MAAKYEYLVEWYGTEEVQARLNQHGFDGWRAVTVAPSTRVRFAPHALHPYTVSGFDCVFERKYDPIKRAGLKP